VLVEYPVVAMSPYSVASISIFMQIPGKNKNIISFREAVEGI